MNCCSTRLHVSLTAFSTVSAEWPSPNSEQTNFPSPNPLQHLMSVSMHVCCLLEYVRLPEHLLGSVADFGNARCRASY